MYYYVLYSLLFTTSNLVFKTCLRSENTFKYRLWFWNMLQWNVWVKSYGGEKQSPPRILLQFFPHFQFCYFPSLHFPLLFVFSKSSFLFLIYYHVSFRILLKYPLNFPFALLSHFFVFFSFANSNPHRTFFTFCCRIHFLCSFLVFVFLIFI